MSYLGRDSSCHRKSRRTLSPWSASRPFAELLLASILSPSSTTSATRTTNRHLPTDGIRNIHNITSLTAQHTKSHASRSIHAVVNQIGTSQTADLAKKRTQPAVFHTNVLRVKLAFAKERSARAGRYKKCLQRGLMRSRQQLRWLQHTKMTYQSQHIQRRRSAPSWCRARESCTRREARTSIPLFLPLLNRTQPAVTGGRQQGTTQVEVRRKMMQRMLGQRDTSRESVKPAVVAIRSPNFQEHL